MSKLVLQDLTNILSQSFLSNWLVEGFIEKKSVCMLFGEPSTYKSFLVMDLAFCIGAGLDWNGSQVSKGQVVYLAGEGFSGIQKRFTALEHKYGCPQQGIFISSKPAELINPNSIKEIIDAINDANAQPSLIVIDTLHRNFGQGDENSSRDFGVLMNNLDTLRAETDATIIFIHHSGHREKNHSRGSSAIRGSLDCEYQLKRKGEGVELICHKMKEFEKPQNQAFELEKVKVSLPTGPADAAYIKRANVSSIAPKPSRSEIVLNALQEAIKTNGKPIPKSILKGSPNLSGQRCVSVTEWRHHAYIALGKELTKKGSCQQAFNRCRTDLNNKSIIGEENGKVFIM